MKIHKEMYYFETKQVRPTQKDTKEHVGLVLAWNGDYWEQIHWTSLRLIDHTMFDEAAAERYSYWMQMPKAPDVNDKEF